MKFKLFLITVVGTAAGVLYMMLPGNIAISLSTPLYTWKFSSEYLYNYTRGTARENVPESYQVNPVANGTKTVNNLNNENVDRFLSGETHVGTSIPTVLSKTENNSAENRKSQMELSGDFRNTMENKTTLSLDIHDKKHGTTQKKSGHKAAAKRYLLPIIYFNIGPNALYGYFEKALTVAIYQNRAIVLIPFPTLHSQGHMQANDLRMFNSTFDVAELEEIVDTVSIEEFKQVCGGSVDAVYTPDKGNFESSNYEKHVEAFSTLYGLTLPHQRFTKDKPVLFEESAETDKMECLGMFGFGAFANMQIPAKENISFSIQNHLVRSKEIRDIAEKIAALICDGKPYLAMHFRNKSGESLRCRQWNGPCQFKMSQLSQNVANIVVDIKMLMKQRKSPCLYVAYPIKYSSGQICL